MTTTVARDHPRTIGWKGTIALAMGGSNQSLFLIGALIAAQGTAAVPLLIVGLLLSWAAVPGWTELILMWPDRVGGIAATCAEAFRPYSPVLANLTGVCYWWGWMPRCGLTAILAADALHSWYLPHVPIHVIAAGIVVVLMLVNLLGVRWATRLAIPIALGSLTLALLVAAIPVISGSVDWGRALSFHLSTPFHGAFGEITSAMAGLYLVGFAAPAFEAAACHVGETIDPARNVPRAMFGAAGVATLYFVVLPIIWLGVFGSAPLEGHLAGVLGPAFAPLVGGAAKAVAVWFIVLNMLHGTLQPLAGASRTLSQLAENGLLPISWTRRNRFDVPWVTTGLTAGIAIAFLQTGDPTWVLAAANLAYLMGIGMPSVAVWLLRRNEPERVRPYRAPRFTVGLGLAAAGGWLLCTVLGFEQFGLPTVITSIAFCYAGAALYAWRRWQDRRGTGLPWSARSLQGKLTAVLIGLVALDAGGYLVAVSHVSHGNGPLVAMLQDIFVCVALLTITVGLVVPGIVAHAVGAMTEAAKRLSAGTLSDLSAAMRALSRGELEAAVSATEVQPLAVRSRDELGEMAVSFNKVQVEIGRVARALGTAKEELRGANLALARTAARQAAVAQLGLRAAESDDLEAVVQEIVSTARAVLGAGSAVIYEYVDGGTDVQVRACAGLKWDPAHTMIGGEPAASIRIESSGEAVITDWRAVGLQPPQLLADAGVCTTLAVAIAEHDRIFGTLSVNFAWPRTVQPDELDTLRALANLLAGSTERKRAAEQMRHRALHDPLTGLPNRTLFVDRLERAIAGCARRGRSVGVLFLDIDYFKFINDSLGHSVGDELLCSIADRIGATLRAGDTVARFGGDEFLVICEDVADPIEVSDVAERIVDALRVPFTLAGSPHVLSTSIGIAIASDPRRASEDLIREADAAMYRAKEDGRDRFEVYDEVMRAKATRRLSVEGELRAALDHGEFCLHYQPIVDVAAGRVVGVEALVRWDHPRRGLLLPEEFIPVAEQSGAIRAIGEWVLETAVRQAAEWMEQCPEHPLSVAVNLSARQVTHQSLLRVVEQALTLSGLPAELLHMEITESALMDPSDANTGRIAAVKDLGVTIVLDDFGTGYSSLAYVKRFPIDILKIDQTFIRDLSTAPVDGSIVQAIIAMADGLGVGVIAEGVETLEQAAVLARMGCTHAQGHLYSPAVPPEEIPSLLAPAGIMGHTPAAAPAA